MDLKRISEKQLNIAISLLICLLMPIFYIFIDDLDVIILYIIFLINAFVIYKNRKNRENLPLSIFTLIFCLYLFLKSNSPLIHFYSYLLSAISFICIRNKIKSYIYIIVGFISLFIISWAYHDEAWNIFSGISTWLVCTMAIIILSNLIGFKFAVPIWLSLMIIFRYGSELIQSYRYSYLTLADVFSAKTAIGLLNEYNLKINQHFFSFFIITIVISAILIIFFKNQNKTKRKLLISFVVFIATFSLMGIRAKSILAGDNDTKVNYLEGFSASIVDSTYIAFNNKYNLDKEKEKVLAFQDDQVDELKQPNIIAVLCETYADVERTFGITSDRNPMKGYDECKEIQNVKTGNVKVDIIGGGTANSEWEFLTGLDLKTYSSMQAPFIYSVDKNYAFTANSSLYDGYQKTFLHPYLQAGWNRQHVYETFKYDNINFIDTSNIFNHDERIRGLITDWSAYQHNIDIIENSDKPQFIMNVTIQNHGDYENLNIQDKIHINESIEKKDEAESYLTLVEHSSKDILKLIHYLENHKEEPTLVIFFGDHYPGGLTEEKDNSYYETPYLVYSNFSEMGDMPDELDLSQLYPYARKAAGLPLSAYEKYIISLNGNTTTREFALARVNNGYF